MFVLVKKKNINTGIAHNVRTGILRKDRRANLMPMLRTKPMETKSSMLRQVASKVMVVSMSSTPFLSNTLVHAPMPYMTNSNVKIYQRLP